MAGKGRERPEKESRKQGCFRPREKADQEKQPEKRRRARNIPRTNWSVHRETQWSFSQRPDYPDPKCPDHAKSDKTITTNRLFRVFISVSLTSRRTINRNEKGLDKRENRRERARAVQSGAVEKIPYSQGCRKTTPTTPPPHTWKQRLCSRNHRVPQHPSGFPLFPSGILMLGFCFPGSATHSWR